MAQPLVSDELWQIVQPLLPVHKPSPKGGHPRVDDRVCLSGILFLLKTGIAWEDFPAEMGCCGMTLWNRFMQWSHAGVWQQLHATLLDRLRAAGELDLETVVVDSSSVRAIHGGKKRAQAPWIAAKMAQSTTSRSMAMARRWRGSSPRPTATTSRSCCR